MAWLKRVWLMAGLLLIVVLVVYAILLLGVLQALGDDEYQSAKRITDMGANLAVIVTAFAVWVEYTRKVRRQRSKRKKQAPRLTNLEADLAELRGRVRLIEPKEAAQI